MRHISPYLIQIIVLCWLQMPFVQWTYMEDKHHKTLLSFVKWNVYLVKKIDWLTIIRIVYKMYLK